MKPHSSLRLAAAALAVAAAAGGAMTARETRNLPEVVVKSRDRQVLHLLGYVREYSSAASEYDTVTLFREKMVDFMIPSKKVSGFKGWNYPRVLAVRSCYRFSNFEGLDSVSDRFRHHFSWSDWVGICRDLEVPGRILDYSEREVSDTVFGRFSPSSVWRRTGDDLYVDIDVLSDTLNRRLVPELVSFMREGTEFTCLDIGYEFSSANGSSALPDDLMKFTFDIVSNGMGRGFQRIFQTKDPIVIRTYATVYIIDREYITKSEAKKWEKNPPRGEDLGICVPPEAPALDPATKRLVDRVEAIDISAIRLGEEPDPRLVAKFKPSKKSFLSRLKNIFSH